MDWVIVVALQNLPCEVDVRLVKAWDHHFSGFHTFFRIFSGMDEE